MGIQKNIRSIIFICIWILAGAGIVVLLIAAANSRSHQTCKGYEVIINGKKDGSWFIDKKDILNVITAKGAVPLKNKSIKTFDLNTIETRLKKEVWVKDAELFFDNNGILRVNVLEREPVARIFTTTGLSYYIDSTGRKLPLSAKMSAKLPVFTGYPFQGRKTKAVEKKMMKAVKDVSMFLVNDPFWMAQVSQIDITSSREFEIIPTIGNHVIEFGDGSNPEDKFDRLFVFYRQVLAKTGMEKYERIKVQYNNQVIGVKKSANN